MKFLVIVLCILHLNDLDALTPISSLQRTPPLIPENAGPSIQGRIINGQIATAGQFPYQAALYLQIANAIGFCGGSLINVYTVLTAAHCLFYTSNATVILGAVNRSAIEPTQQRFYESRCNFGIHENYNTQNLTNDIAVIRLSKPAFLNRFVQLIPLSYNCNDRVGEIATVSGWGLTSDFSRRIPDLLRWTKVKIISVAECSDFYFPIDSKQICTRGPLINAPCRGDSGGPLVINNELVGVVSFGSVFGCELGLPVGYSRVSAYIQWIAANSYKYIYYQNRDDHYYK